MSVELAPLKQEHLESLDELRNDVEHALPEHGEKIDVRILESEKQQKLHEARKVAAETAQSEEVQYNVIEQLQQAEEAPQATSPQHINQELKQITLRRELQSIRRKLPKSERALSSVIHQPLMRAVSEASSKTVSRPSGLLGGGIVALIGTTGYLYLAKHIGFQYNYGVFLALFAGGFAMGLILELLVHLATASRRRASE